MSEFRELTEEEHLAYHLEVGLRGCGVEGCDPLGDGLRMHFEALALEDDDA